MTHQAFIRETLRPYAIHTQECTFAGMGFTELTEKFIEAIRINGKDWEKVSEDTGKDKSVLLMYSKMLQEQIEQKNDSNLQDVTDTLKNEISQSFDNDP